MQNRPYKLYCMTRHYYYYYYYGNRTQGTAVNTHTKYNQIERKINKKENKENKINNSDVTVT